MRQRVVRVVLAVRAGQDPEHLQPVPREGVAGIRDRETEPRHVELDLLDEPAIGHRDVRVGLRRNRDGGEVGFRRLPAAAMKDKLTGHDDEFSFLESGRPRSRNETNDPFAPTMT